jgi:glycogen operon protein
VSWYGAADPHADFSPAGHALAYCLRGGSLQDDDIYVMVNAGADAIVFHIHEGSAADWMLVADTGIASPGDFVLPAERHALSSAEYMVTGRSVVVLCKGPAT